MLCSKNIFFQGERNPTVRVLVIRKNFFPMGSFHFSLSSFPCTCRFLLYCFLYFDLSTLVLIVSWAGANGFEKRDLGKRLPISRSTGVPIHSGRNVVSFNVVVIYNRMNIWLFPTANVLINTFLRSIVVIIAVLLAGYSWYTAYWGAVIHDAVSLVLIRSYV